MPKYYRYKLNNNNNNNIRENHEKIKIVVFYALNFDKFYW